MAYHFDRYIRNEADRRHVVVGELIRGKWRHRGLFAPGSGYFTDCVKAGRVMKEFDRLAVELHENGVLTPLATPVPLTPCNLKCVTPV